MIEVLDLVGLVEWLAPVAGAFLAGCFVGSFAAGCRDERRRQARRPVEVIHVHHPNAMRDVKVKLHVLN